MKLIRSASATLSTLLLTQTYIPAGGVMIYNSPTSQSVDSYGWMENIKMELFSPSLYFHWDCLLIFIFFVL